MPRNAIYDKSNEPKMIARKSDWKRKRILASISILAFVFIMSIIFSTIFPPSITLFIIISIIFPGFIICTLIYFDAQSISDLKVIDDKLYWPHKGLSFVIKNTEEFTPLINIREILIVNGGKFKYVTKNIDINGRNIKWTFDTDYIYLIDNYRGQITRSIKKEDIYDLNEFLRCMPKNVKIRKIAK